MQLVVRNRTQNVLELEIKEEDHTLLNLLKYFLLEDSRVEFASYAIEFPGITHPVLYLRVAPGLDPIQVLEEVISRIIDYCLELESKFKAELKHQAVLLLQKLAELA